VQRVGLRARRRSSGINAQRGGGVASGRGGCGRQRLAGPLSLFGALRALSLVVRRRGGLRARRRSSSLNPQRTGGVSSGRGGFGRRRFTSPLSLSGALRALSLVVRRRGGLRARRRSSSLNPQRAGGVSSERGG